MLSAAQVEMLRKAAADRHGRVYQADHQAPGREAGRSAARFVRTGQSLVRRKLMVDVSSAGVFEITSVGREEVSRG